LLLEVRIQITHKITVKLFTYLLCINESTKFHQLAESTSYDGLHVCVACTGKIILSTVQENSEFLKHLLKVQPQAFKPSIPHLVYQYNFYTNYQSKHLSVCNPEIVGN
jgi:hypothetical protein